MGEGIRRDTQISKFLNFYFSLGVSVIIHPTPSGQDDNNIIYDDDYYEQKPPVSRQS